MKFPNSPVSVQDFTATGTIYGNGTVVAAKIQSVQVEVTLESNQLEGFDFDAVKGALDLLLPNVIQPALDGKYCFFMSSAILPFVIVNVLMALVIDTLIQNILTIRAYAE